MKPMLHIFMPSHHERDANAGAAGADIRLAKALEERGHKVDLVFYEDIYSSKRIYGYWRQLLFPWMIAKHFWKGHAQRPYDVVDCTAGSLSMIHKSLSLKRRKNRPLLAVRSHLLEHLAVESDRKAALLEGRKLQWKFNLYHAAYRLREVAQDFKIADVVFVLNQGKKEFVSDKFRVPPKKIYTVPNGVSDYFFEGNGNFDSNKLYRILFIGGWTSRKGIGVIPQIAKELFQNDDRFRLTCAGVLESKEQVLQAFPESCRERIEIISRFQNQDLPGLMRDYGIFILPSLLESFSLAILEAMASGLIVISTPCGIAPEIIIPSKNGFLAPENDSKAFVETIKKIVSQGTLMREISENAIATARRFTWANAAEIREKIYLENLNSNQVR